MKHTILIILLFISFCSYSQVSISCNYKEVCIWNDTTEDFEKCNKREHNSLFKINKDETMITHTTESKKTVYYVSDKESPIENVISYMVMSDVGTEHSITIFLKSREIKIIQFHLALSEQSTLEKYYIKTAF